MNKHLFVSLKIGCCLPECAPPSITTFPNGGLETDQDSYAVGSLLTYTCNENFATRDIVVTECLDTSFTWSLDENVPTCRRSEYSFYTAVLYCTFLGCFEKNFSVTLSQEVILLSP